MASTPDGLASDPARRSPTVSIIVPAYNEESIIGQCLAAALDQTVPAHEIIVVDNRSTDGTTRIVSEIMRQHPGRVRLLHQDARQGLVPTRNLGFASATGDVLGRIDSDSIIKPDWVEQVQRAFADPKVQGATGPVIYYDMPLRRLGLRIDNFGRKATLKIDGDIRFLFGTNMAIRASAWKIIGPQTCLDDEDRMHEDIDLSLHMYENRLHIAYCPEMIAGMSARRLDDSPRAFADYIRRFDRTYAAHNIRKLGLRTPELIFMSIYYPLHIVRPIYVNRRKSHNLETRELLWHSPDKRAAGRRRNLHAKPFRLPHHTADDDRIASNRDAQAWSDRM